MPSYRSSGKYPCSSSDGDQHIREAGELAARCGLAYANIQSLFIRRGRLRLDILLRSYGQLAEWREEDVSPD